MEVRHILGLHKKLFGRVAELNELERSRPWIGRPFDSPEARTPRYVQKAIRKAIADTASNTGMVLTVAFDYGSRAEIVHAAEVATADGRRRVTAADLDAGHVPRRAAAGRRRRAHLRRATDLQLPALAIGRVSGLLHRADVARLRRSRARRRHRRRPRLTAAVRTLSTPRRAPTTANIGPWRPPCDAQDQSSASPAPLEV